MKYLKKFNEELKPDVYRRAGWQLQSLGKHKRGAGLIDWADTGESGIYKMHHAQWPNSLSSIGEEFTKPRLLKFWFGRPKNGVDNKIDYPQYNAETLVSNWLRGESSLSFTLEFGFKPLESTKLSTKNTKIKKCDNYVPMFSIVMELSDFYEGIDYYNDPENYDGADIEPADSSQFYENTKFSYAYLERPNDPYWFGIFADRASAFKFKRWFDSEIENWKENIMDILYEVYPEASEVDKILQELKSIRVNSLYCDDPKSVIPSAWYHGKNKIN